MPGAESPDHIRSVTGLILTGGSSQRLGGGDKALRLLGGRSILHQICARLQPQLASIVLSANSDPALFAAFDYPLIHDGEWQNCGPLAGILAGCRYGADHGFKDIVSVAGDTPFFPDNLVQQLLASRRRSKAQIIFARSNGMIHPTFALWPATIAQQLEDWLTTSKRRSIRAFADQFSLDYADFDNSDTLCGLDPFFNINTQDQLIHARSAWQLSHEP